MAGMAGRKKEMENELDVLNKSLKPHNKQVTTIENFIGSPDTISASTKPDIFKVLKDLYTLAKKAISEIQPHEGTDTNSPTMDLVKEELAKLLPGLIKEGMAGLAQPRSDGVKTPDPAPIVMHTLVIEKIIGEEEEEGTDIKISENEWSTVVKKDIKNTLKSVPVRRAHATPGGTAQLQFNTRKDMVEAEEALRDKYKVTPKSEERTKLNPKITIFGIESEISTMETLEEEILIKNHDIRKLKEKGEEFKIVFLDEKDRFAVCQVSPEIRESLKRRGDRICLGLEMHNVKDRYHVIQCYHCQGFGHTSGSPYCKSKDAEPTCFYCAGNHKSKECLNRKDRKTRAIKCVNCSNSRSRAERNEAKTHKASDNLCPSYIRETERVMSRTLSSEEAKNVYQIRVKELLQNRRRN